MNQIKINQDREQLRKEINRLRSLRYTWRQIKETLFDGPNPPCIATIQRWSRGLIPNQAPPIHERPYPIVPKHKEEVREVFIKQLKSMGYNERQIKEELKRLIP